MSIIGTASDPALVARFDLQRSRYEGPTGIVGCLHDACTAAGIPSLSLWATVPAYAPGHDVAEGRARPRAAGRRRSSARPSTARSLEREVEEYEREVDEYVGRDEDLQSYVERLERLVDEGATTRTTRAEREPNDAHPAEDAGSVERLVAEVEQFLRDQGPEG